ncbi:MULTISPECIES: phosphotransferase [Aliiglaciecola]|uniref:phosphotransferase n=1 Tax=Aliiglaciecola TaxID=1406885 RepID=UPI001C08526B|nr:MULTISPECIES: phosphotransferase [Aliiglaciecola]MBU2879602.1 ecdysteroid 22-kinase family protein [Aliiglaciecola lipolytica]MDO6710118.1 phosphotransferase [Aliiglaciecola sp. 2_MG-2023]MDO6751266.1 phosphotransferase [Aliiglaciecola sp. 1_MG-2023]
MDQSYHSALLEILKGYFQDQNLHKVESIQTLWSGYGEIARYNIPTRQRNYVVKVVNPNSESAHPRGWNTSISHLRKLDSYQNEQIFYDSYSGLTDQYSRIPKCIASGQNQQIRWLIMEDLDASGFTYRCDDAPLDLVKLGVRWLAYFHARFLNNATPELWPIGTYWHLKTRPDEYQKMPEGRLKEAATGLDQQLNSASYQTLLHGDAKLANFCFSAHKDDLAAVDFQYVGRGVGVKDLAYFLGSCFYQDGLFKHAETLLNDYFSHFKKALLHYQVNCNFGLLEEQWRALYPLAWADFERFLSGWATEHYKRNEYMQKQTELALAYLNQHKSSS